MGADPPRVNMVQLCTDETTTSLKLAVVDYRFRVVLLKSTL